MTQYRRILKQMLNPNNVTGFFSSLKQYEDDVRIEFGVLARKALFTKITQTQTQKKNSEKKGRNKLKVKCYNCQKLEYMASDFKVPKQPRNFK